MNDDSGESSDADISTAETVVMVVSALVTVGLFGFAISQAFVGGGPADPTVTVVDERVAADGRVVYTVELRNRGDVGLIAVTVEAACTDPPVTLQFQNVPASGTRKGAVVCPPATRDPSLSVTSWVQE